MIVRCPTCGADVEFRFDDSFVRVCDHCRSAVVRTDRGAETLGRFADLVPIASALRLFAEGRYGTAGFQLLGMAQLRHAAGGVWQEWYARLDGGQWAWLSEAQGRLYVTFERSDVAPPPMSALRGLAPGTQVQLAGQTFVVTENATATYVSALGEIPYRLVPNQTLRFVDLSDGRGGFATIDYGDGSEPPAVYLGTQVAPDSLALSGGEAPQTAAPATASRLACPSCNGSLELRAPDQTLRVACPYCGALVNVEGGALSILARQAHVPRPRIALGSKATFAEGEMTVIGHVQRSAQIDDEWWPFEEYLLHAPAIGFRWLVCSDGHWSYVQPVSGGAVFHALHARYGGVVFRRFQIARLRVDSVVGEFYWRVTAGETVDSEDYVAPPAMLSRESSASEENWSLSTYLTPQDVVRALGQPADLPLPTGVAPNQPYPGGVGKAAALLGVAFCAVGIGTCASAPGSERMYERFTVPMKPTVSAARPAATLDPLTAPPPLPSVGSGDAAGSGAGSGGAAEPAGEVLFSQPFHLDGSHNVEFTLTSNVSNNWVYGAFDLVNQDTGGVVSFDKSLEYYAGTDDGESWSEGSRSETEVIGPVEAGNYLLRVEAQHGGLGDVALSVRIRQGVFRWPWFWLGFAVMMTPFALVALHAVVFRKRRWSNSNIVRSE